MNLIDDNIAKCESCACVMDVTLVQPFTNVECPDCGTHNRVKVDVGSYVLKKRQGVGGMSLVFGAVDKHLGREVAIKILNENYSMDKKRIEQFEQEAKITAAISHPHVVRVYTVGKAFERFYISMELVPGDSLEKKMHDDGALSEMDVLKWGRQVCEGLDAANKAGLIHRDIKPGNILLDAKGDVKIVDFGLALVTQGGKAQAEEVWATPYYVPPETLEGKEEDFRSDLYALGSSMSHALTGVAPFDNESRSTTELKQLKMNLPPLKQSAPWVNDHTCAIIDKTMAFYAEDRFSSYDEIIDAIKHAEMVLETVGEVPPRGIPLIYQQQPKMSRGLLYGIIAACVVVIVGIIIALSGDPEEKEVADKDELDTKMLGIEGSDDGGAAGRRLAVAIRQGREALNNKNYDKVVSIYNGVVRDIRFTTNSAMWAGLQGSIVSWLNGKPEEAKRCLINTSKRYQEAQNKEQVGDATELTDSLVESIPILLRMEKIDPASLPAIRSEVQSMLVFASALKNWEEGYTDEALSLFAEVEEYAKNQDAEFSDEFSAYVSIISDYKEDAELMQPFLEKFYPSSDLEIDGRRAKLKKAKSKLKTNGRAVENFEEWLIQLDIHENRLAYEKKMAANNGKGGNGAGGAGGANGEAWEKFYKDLEKDIAASKFLFVSEKLKLRSFKDKTANKKKGQMIYLCEKASGYIGTLSETLSKGVIKSEIILKDGRKFSSFSGIDTKGVVLKDRQGAFKATWGNIKTDSVLNLHNISMKEAGDLSQFEKNLRLEQAIAYAWLGGEKDKAKTAAGNLVSMNPLFKNRWEACMKSFD